MTVSPVLRRRDVRDLAAEKHGIVTAADLVELGMPASTRGDWVRSGRLVRLAPRSYLVPGLFDDLSHLQAVQCSYPSSVGSHLTAGWMLGLDGFDILALDISVPYGASPRLGRVFRTADLEPFDITTVSGLRITNATRTLCDAGRVVGPDVVERGTEAALRRRLTSLPRLEWRLAALSRPGRAGPSTLRHILDQRPPNSVPTESDLETRYLQCLRSRGVPEPRRQHRVVVDGRIIARLDLAFPEQRVFVELDGWEAHRSRAAFVRDRRRQNAVVVALGWLPLRFTWDDVVGDGDRVASETLAAIS